MSSKDRQPVMDPLAVDFGPAFFAIEFGNFALGENKAIFGGYLLDKGGEVFERMKLCLGRKANSGGVHSRNPVQIFGIKSELIRELRIFVELTLIRCAFVIRNRRM